MDNSGRRTKLGMLVTLALGQKYLWVSAHASASLPRAEISKDKEQFFQWHFISNTPLNEHLFWEHMLIAVICKLELTYPLKIHGFFQKDSCRVVLDCSKSYDSLILLDLWEPGKSLSSNAFKIQISWKPSSLSLTSYIFPVFIFTSTVYLMFLTRVIIFSGAHAAFYIVFYRTCAIHQNSKIFGKKVSRKFWYWNHEKAKKASILGQNLSYKKDLYS